jgi:hypothetical protein
MFDHGNGTASSGEGLAWKFVRTLRVFCGDKRGWSVGGVRWVFVRTVSAGSDDVRKLLSLGAIDFEAI